MLAGFLDSRRKDPHFNLQLPNQSLAILTNVIYIVGENIPAAKFDSYKYQAAVFESQGRLSFRLYSQYRFEI